MRQVSRDGRERLSGQDEADSAEARRLLMAGDSLLFRPLFIGGVGVLVGHDCTACPRAAASAARASRSLPSGMSV